jgi:hypothetical protein
MPKKNLIEEAKKENKDPFWLLLMAVLILFTVLLLIDRNRIAILIGIGVIICYALYRNPIGGKY